jgi:hypothetical protein
MLDPTFQRSCDRPNNGSNHLDLWYKEVFAAAKHIECLDPVDAAPDRIFRDRECAPFFLQA